jgi:hypothetical protein
MLHAGIFLLPRQASPGFLPAAFPVWVVNPERNTFGQWKKDLPMATIELDFRA